MHAEVGHHVCGIVFVEEALPEGSELDNQSSQLCQCVVPWSYLCRGLAVMTQLSL